MCIRDSGILVASAVAAIVGSAILFRGGDGRAANDTPADAVASTT